MKASINTQLERNGLIISVDCEHKTRMDHIVSASATHPVTQVGYVACTNNVERKVEYNFSLCTAGN